MTQWIYFILLSALGYLGISIFSQLVGSNTPTFLDAVKNIFRPLPLLIMVVANVFLASAVYFGFLATPAAVTVMLAIGIITSLIYSIFALGVTITATKVSGVVLIIGGIYLLK